TDWETALPALFREAFFRKAVLYLEGADLLPRRMLESLMDSCSGVVIASGQQALPNWFSLSLPFPGLEASRRTWERAAAEQGLALSSGNAKVLSARLRLTSAQIRGAVQTARSRAAWRGAAKAGLKDYIAAARANSGQELALLARKVPARHTWDDIVLPDD